MRSVPWFAFLLFLTAAKADLVSSFSSSISGNLADGTPYSATGGCAISKEQAFTYCGGGTYDGQAVLGLAAAGSGSDRGPKLFAHIDGSVTYTDQIVFSNRQVGDATIAWSIAADLSPSADDFLSLPTMITFNVAYPITMSIWDYTAAGSGEDENWVNDSIAITGFQVFAPACEAELTLYGGSIYDPTTCGPPMDVSVHTRSGFLYGGHVPEPSSFLLLATAAGMAWLVRRSRRLA